ncbi:MAG: phage scaffolding protein [Anaerolineaceae bacterium]|nr:phage scaffolding protein [Anaerolineaceae bacterium]
MNREFLKNAGVPEDQLDKIMAEYGKDIQAEKDKAAKAAADLTEANKTIETYKSQVTELEKKAGDNADVKKQLDDLKAQIEQSKKEAEAKAADEQMTTVIREAFPKDKKFVNEYTEQALISQIKAELGKPENKGKGVSEILSVITKDKTGIYENPNQPGDMSGFKNPEVEGSNEAAMRRIFGLEPKGDK